MRRLLSRVVKLAELAVMVAAGIGVIGAVAFFTVPKVLGWHGVIVLTGSMEPALKTGGLAFIDEGVSANSIGAGDIITFRDPSAERQVTHRVAEVVHDDSRLSFRTKGDANDTADQTLVPAGNLVGREVFAVPEVGNWSNWIRAKDHLFMILWLPAGLVIAGELTNIFKDLRKKNLQKQIEKDPPLRGETAVEAN
jgi:signal peptidase